MKASLLSLVALLALSSGVFAQMQEPNSFGTPPQIKAPVINGDIKRLNARLQADIAARTLSDVDVDDIKRRIQDVQNEEQNITTLTPAIRADLRGKLAKIKSDLDREEAEAQPAASPAPSPAVSGTTK